MTRDKRSEAMSKSREFCVIEVDGSATDASLHELILEGAHPTIDAIGRAEAKRAGLTDEEIAQLYPPK
jgi:hypothetical protein